MISDNIQAFLNYGRHYWSDATFAYYDVSLRIFNEFLEQKDIQVSYDTIINDYVAYLREYRKKDKKKLSNTSINTYLRAVRSFYNWLYKNGSINVNYFGSYHKLRSDQEQIVPLTAAEVVKIDSVFKVNTKLGLRDYLIFHLMLDCGLRSQEVQHIHVSDVHFDGSFLVINNSKYNKNRVVPLPAFLLQLIETHLQKNKQLDFTSFLLCTTSGEDITKNVIRTLFIKIRKKSGVLRVYPHLLRHTFATSFLLGGGNLEELRLLLGHSTYNVTQTYLHLSFQYKITGLDIYKLDNCYFKKGY